jgi:iron complex transport system ATP-binding protein
MLKANSISLIKGNRQILKEMTIEIQPGCITILVGPNGAGKSSLMRLLSGEWQPTSGNIELEGCALSEWSLQDLARIRAVLNQGTLLEFPFKVGDVVLMGLTPFNEGFESAKDRVLAESALDQVDLSGFWERNYLNLSGGEKQRVHLARILCQINAAMRECESTYLLLDEPTAMLDLGHRHLVFSLIRQLAQRGCGIFIILHELNLAMSYADQLVLLNASEMVAQGNPVEVLSPDRVASVFGVAAWHVAHPAFPKPLIATQSVNGIR